MQFFSTSAIAALLTAPLGVIAAPATTDGTTVSVSYDSHFDNAALDLTTVACSNGENGLITKGYATLGSLPKFPLVGGAPTVAGWNSPNCGACYGLTYKDKTIYVTAVDAAPAGFNIAEAALNQLTNNQAVQLGRIEATYAPADPSNCGF